tara:strand:- start:4913 stop:5185 length:273 start_codon:yes stop_codon:yes gene_type:complete
MKGMKKSKTRNKLRGGIGKLKFIRVLYFGNVERLYKSFDWDVESELRNWQTRQFEKLGTYPGSAGSRFLSKNENPASGAFTQVWEETKDA